MVPEGGPLPDLRFTSGSKDETRSQCLGDNKVFDELPRAVAGRKAPESPPCWSGAPGARAGGRAGGSAGHQHAGAARSVLEGCRADLARLTREVSPGEREDAAAGVTQCSAAAFLPAS